VQQAILQLSKESWWPSVWLRFLYLHASYVHQHTFNRSRVATFLSDTDSRSRSTKLARMFTTTWIQLSNSWATNSRMQLITKTLESSSGSWWKCPGGLRNFISGWTYRIVALAVFIISGVFSHSSSINLIKLVIFSCPYWYIENIHFSLMKPNPSPKA